MSKFLPQPLTLQSAAVGQNTDHSFLHRVYVVDTTSPEQSMYINGSGYVQIVNIPSYADNAAAVSGGLEVGFLYRNGDVLQIVHA